MRATELLRNKFGVSQVTSTNVKEGDEVVLEHLLASSDHC